MIGWRKAEATLEIPATLGGLPVLAIGDYAFADCTVLQSVTVAQGVLRIGDGAFSGCAVLKSVSIPSTVVSVGAEAFAGTAALEEEGGVYYIGDCLVGCDEIEGRVEIKSGTRLIADRAFEGHAGIRAVSFPPSLRYIGKYAFAGCKNLRMPSTNGIQVEEGAFDGIAK